MSEQDKRKPPNANNGEPQRSRGWSTTDAHALALERIALNLGLTHGGKGSVSKLLSALANGSLRIVR